LRALQEQHISWRKAVGCYHSYTAEFHFPYRQRVFETWTRIRQRTPLGPPTGRARPLWASACTSFPRRGPKGVRPAASRSERPMSAFYASLNRRTSGKLYHASLCRNHSQLY
jgi:hypothetical protein